MQTTKRPGATGEGFVQPGEWAPGVELPRPAFYQDTCLSSQFLQLAIKLTKFELLERAPVAEDAGTLYGAGIVAESNAYAPIDGRSSAADRVGAAAVVEVASIAVCRRA